MFVDTHQTAQELLIRNYLRVFANSILFYDHVITLGREVEYIWRRPKTKSSCYFFLNRYNSLLGNVISLTLRFTGFSSRSCRYYLVLRQIFLVINQLITCFLLSLRVYALYSCSRRIRSLMVCTGASLFAIALWLAFGQENALKSKCYIGVSNETAIRMSSAWWALFVYDAFLFTLTVSKTWTINKSYTTSVTISQILLRDGSVYFAVIALSNFANILTCYLCGTFLKGGLSTFSADISSTMMSHLMLNLHEVSSIGIHTTMETTRIELDTLWSGTLDQASASLSVAFHDPRAGMDDAQEPQDIHVALPHINP